MQFEQKVAKNLNQTLEKEYPQLPAKTYVFPNLFFFKLSNYIVKSHLTNLDFFYIHVIITNFEKLILCRYFSNESLINIFRKNIIP